MAASESEALVEGLRLLQTREQLRHDVNSAIGQLDRGEVIDGEEVFGRWDGRIDEAVR